MNCVQLCNLRFWEWKRDRFLLRDEAHISMSLKYKRLKRSWVSEHVGEMQKDIQGKWSWSDPTFASWCSISDLFVYLIAKKFLTPETISITNNHVLKESKRRKGINFMKMKWNVEIYICTYENYVVYKR